MINKCIRLILITCFLFSCSTTNKNKKKDESALYTEIAMNNFQESKYEDALESFMKALEINPENVEAHIGIGMTYYFKNRSDMALRHLKKATEIDPKNCDAKLNYGYVLMMNGDIDSAIAEFDYVSEDLLYKFTYKAYKNKAEAYFLKKDYSTSLKLVDKALANKSDFCEASYLKGKILIELGNYKLAEEALNNSIAGFCTTFVEAQYEIALLMLKKKEYKKAESKFKEIIDRFPTHDLAKKAADRLKM